MATQQGRRTTQTILLRAVTVVFIVGLIVLALSLLDVGVDKSFWPIPAAMTLFAIVAYVVLLWRFRKVT
jgi:uncharacterized membrane protein